MIYLSLAVGVFLLDFFVKRHIDRTYAASVRHPRFGGRIILEKYYNDGAALNFLAKHPKQMRALHTAVILAAGAVYVITLRSLGKPLEKTGLSLLIGGGANNLLDRFAKGHVVDYFRIRIGSKRLERIIFNLSDFFIFIGALLAVIGSEQAPRRAG